MTETVQSFITSYWKVDKRDGWKSQAAVVELACSSRTMHLVFGEMKDGNSSNFLELNEICKVFVPVLIWGKIFVFCIISLLCSKNIKTATGKIINTCGTSYEELSRRYLQQSGSLHTFLDDAKIMFRRLSFFPRATVSCVFNYQRCSKEKRHHRCCWFTIEDF